jgi:hypothetical protein
MTFWGIIWLFFWSFAIIAYLMALFSIIVDIFRDHTLAGGWKALWLLFLFFVPFLTALVYLIARGSGMGERAAAAANQNKAAADDYIRTVASTTPAQEISQAKALADAGTITQAEFEAIKAKALAGTKWPEQE